MQGETSIDDAGQFDIRHAGMSASEVIVQMQNISLWSGMITNASGMNYKKKIEKCPMIHTCILSKERCVIQMFTFVYCCCANKLQCSKIKCWCVKHQQSTFKLESVRTRARTHACKHTHTSFKQQLSRNRYTKHSAI